jgi:hypothetical protein
MIDEPLFLTPSQMRDLTGRTHHRAQMIALALMGIKHAVRPDGRPLVLVKDLSSVFNSNMQRTVVPKNTLRLDLI